MREGILRVALIFGLFVFLSLAFGVNLAPTSLAQGNTEADPPKHSRSTLNAIVAVARHTNTFRVIHNFTDGNGGAYPMSGLTMDRAGTFYGTTEYGGDYSKGYPCELNTREPGCGTVYKFSKTGSTWIFAPTLNFESGDGAYPLAGVAPGPDGELYGTTFLGGVIGGVCGDFGCGTVFQLHPGRQVREKAIYKFTGEDDGSEPYSDLVFDKAGNLYGANVGGPNSCGAIYQLTPSGTRWSFSVIYNFACGQYNDEIAPQGLMFDASGNLYGITRYGGSGSCPSGVGRGCGTLFELTSAGSTWKEKTLHNFTDSTDGGWVSPPVMDKSGNLFGATELGGAHGAGTIWEYSLSTGKFAVLYSFQGSQDSGPAGKLAIDASGTLYGMTTGGGSNYNGNVFQLRPSKNRWVYTDLHDFTGGSDGGSPERDITLDSNGNLLGTAPRGGSGGYGVIFEITR